jgi:hypothetical protein
MIAGVIAGTVKALLQVLLHVLLQESHVRELDHAGHTAAAPVLLQAAQVHLRHQAAVLGLVTAHCNIMILHLQGGGIIVIVDS